MAVIGPSTELEAVNILLSTIGEAPVNTLSGQLPVDASIAKTVLAETSREVQSEGWQFNTETQYPLARTIDGEVPLPLNTLRVHLSDTNIVQRGSKLYDKTNHTYTFDTPQEAETIILALDFDELPEPARRYITAKAARIFQGRALGSEKLAQFTTAEETRARSVLLQHEAETAQNNIFGDYPSNWNIGKVIGR